MVINLATVVEVCVLYHLVGLFLGESFAQNGNDVSDFGNGDGSGVGFVEYFEGFNDILFHVAHILDLAGHEGEEDGKIDLGSSNFAQILFDFEVGGVGAERSHHGAQLFGVDGSVAVLVEEGEGLLELSDL